MKPFRFHLLALCIICFLIPLAPHAGAVLTVKEVALDEARKCDANYNGKIEGSEVQPLKDAFKKPKSFLYLFDANENHSLDEYEIAKIKFTPAPKPAGAAAASGSTSLWKSPPAGAKKPAPKPAGPLPAAAKLGQPKPFWKSPPAPASKLPAKKT